MTDERTPLLGDYWKSEEDLLPVYNVARDEVVILRNTSKKVEEKKSSLAQSVCSWFKTKKTPEPKRKTVVSEKGSSNKGTAFLEDRKRMSALKNGGFEEAGCSTSQPLIHIPLSAHPPTLLDGSTKTTTMTKTGTENNFVKNLKEKQKCNIMDRPNPRNKVPALLPSRLEPPHKK